MHNYDSNNWYPMYREVDTSQMLNFETDSGDITKIDYFIVIVVVCISGNPIIVNGTQWYGVIAVFIMLMVCLVFRRTLINILFIKWLVGFIFLFALQGIILSEISIPAEINFISKLYVIFLAVSFLGTKFRSAYFNVMYIISVISLVCFGLNYLGINIGWQFEKYRTIFIYNNLIRFEKAHIFRNCGMFWEPGAFQGYIMLGFLFFINDYKSLWKIYRWKCIILSLALLTTFSTTGYIVYLLYIAYIISTSYINHYIKAFLVFLVLICCIYAYYNFDFLGKKIERQYENAMNLRSNEVSWSRMGAMKIDFQQILRHPLVGNGFVMSSRYEKLGNKMAGAGNGFTGAINMLGVPCIAIYLMALYRSLNFNSKKQNIFFISLIVILLNGEFFLNYPLFWGLPFITLSDKN